MRYLTFLFLSTLALCLGGCQQWDSFSSFVNPDFEAEADMAVDSDYSEDELISFERINSAQATSIVQDFAAEARHNHHLQLEQANTYYEDGIRSIQVRFSSQDLIEMCEARELTVDLTENLLAKLNQNPILAGDFANYPFRPENLELYITFESYFGKYVDPYYIRWICLEDGQVAYYTFDLLDLTKKNWHVRRESYAASREIVVYQREAERKYLEIYQPKVNIFGSDRYFPDEQKSGF